MPASDIVLIAHNLRSTHNVGSLMRTAEGLGITKLYLTGYTPHPETTGDERLPHISKKLTAQIHKTALGAETSLKWDYINDIFEVLEKLRTKGYIIAGLEQDTQSLDLASYGPSDKIALIVGREVEGLESTVRRACDVLLEIPMAGRKESFNVVQAAAIALYHLTYVKI